MRRDCGGCEGIGAHRRWCEAEHGHLAARYGSQAAKAEALADEIGANVPEAANALYRAAGLLNAEAIVASATYRSRKADQ